jgi:hypothetical protein
VAQGALAVSNYESFRLVGNPVTDDKRASKNIVLKSACVNRSQKLMYNGKSVAQNEIWRS